MKPPKKNKKENPPSESETRKKIEELDEKLKKQKKAIQQFLEQINEAKKIETKKNEKL